MGQIQRTWVEKEIDMAISDMKNYYTEKEIGLYIQGYINGLKRGNKIDSEMQSYLNEYKVSKLNEVFIK